MATLDGFRPAGEVVAEERTRVPVSKAGAHRDDRYAVSVNDDGVILLVPVVSIPRREVILHENGEVRASVLRRLAEAVEGRARPLDRSTRTRSDFTAVPSALPPEAAGL